MLNNGTVAGILKKERGEYSFVYTDSYLLSPKSKAISRNFPKTQPSYLSNCLFPFFFNMLPEGVNKSVVCKKFKIDEKDYFSLLLQVAGHDTIGAVTVIPKEE